MEGYKIQEATWGTVDNKDILLKVLGDNGESFFYSCNETDDAPLNQLLWNQVMQNPKIIQDSFLTKVLKGLLPVPEGFTLIDGQLLNDEQEKMRVRQKINEQLDILYCGRSIAMSERDPIYAENRQKQIEWLLSLENTSQFPYYIDWVNQEV